MRCGSCGIFTTTAFAASRIWDTKTIRGISRSAVSWRGIRPNRLARVTRRCTCPSLCCKNPCRHGAGQRQVCCRESLDLPSLPSRLVLGTSLSLPPPLVLPPIGVCKPSGTTPGGFDMDDLLFDPTSTPSRGIKFGAPFAMPKNMRPNGLFEMPSKRRDSSNRLGQAAAATAVCCSAVDAHVWRLPG
ncbi:hypothetical protein B0H14DRAFT_2883181 [Mycena olivaceomarginata]|nr:hypothetical protein B0H14DRAFT_2883181 [Mycena olivaceomarginata]